MTKFLYNILCILFLAGIAAAASGCSEGSGVPGYEEPENEMPAVEPTECRLLFRVNAGGRQRTRAEGDGFELTPGQGMENYVDLYDMELYLFDTDDKLVSHLTDPDVRKEISFGLALTYPGASETLYNVWFRMEKIFSDISENPRDFKILMLANWGNSYPSSSSLKTGVTTITDLTEDASSIAIYNPTSALEKIPFFGVQEYRNIQFKPGAMTTCDDELNLIRALAKVEVYDAEGTLMPIQTLSLKRYNTKFRKAPLNVSHQDGYIGSPNLPGLSLPNDNSWENQGEETLTLVKDVDGHFRAFLPEYRNIGRDDNERARLLVDYGNDQVFEVDFRYTQNPPAGSNVGDFYDLRRNYWYRIEINLRTEFKLDIESAQPIPYHPVVLKPSFGL